MICCIFYSNLSAKQTWRVPDTGHTKCYDNEKEKPCPKPDEDFYGQEGNYTKLYSQASIYDDIIVECWGNDITDNKINGWKSTYPHCILDDGMGGSNAIYDGKFSVDNSRICITLENLRTVDTPSHTLAVGFKITLLNGHFLDDNSVSKIVEMAQFRLTPNIGTVNKCFDLISDQPSKLIITSPNSVTWTIGENQLIQWQSENIEGPVSIEISYGRMYSLGEMNFIQGMLDLGNCKNSVGLKPNAELRKDAKAPSIPKS